MYPGDILFGDYEEELSGAWVRILAGRERGFRILTAIYRIVHKRPVDFIFFDLGPNLGSLTRSLLLSSDYFISPMIPDAFSIRATENFVRKLRDSVNFMAGCAFQNAIPPFSGTSRSTKVRGVYNADVQHLSAEVH